MFRKITLRRPTSAGVEPGEGRKEAFRNGWEAGGSMDTQWKEWYQFPALVLDPFGTNLSRSIAVLPGVRGSDSPCLGLTCPNPNLDVRPWMLFLTISWCHHSGE